MCILEHYPEAMPGVLTKFLGPYARVRLLRPEGTIETLTVVWDWRMPAIAAALLAAVAIGAAAVLRRR